MTKSARGALCAAVLAMLCSPAVAGPKKSRAAKKTARVSIASCTSFDQRDRDDDGVDVVVSNQCEVRLACSVSWSLACVPAAGKTRRSQHGQAFSLAIEATETTSITPEACGNDGWEIDNVSWSCQPDPEPKSVATR